MLTIPGADHAPTVATLSSREFLQDARGALQAAELGPVIITDLGRAAHVLLAFEAYQRLLSAGPSLACRLAQTEAGEVAFEPPRLGEVAPPPEPG